MPTQSPSPHTTKQVPYLQIEDTHFNSSEKWMKAYQYGKSTTTITACTLIDASLQFSQSSATNSEVKQFFDKCMNSPLVPVFFSVLEESYCNSFTKSADCLPISLQSINDPEHLLCTYLELLEAGEQMKELLEIISIQQKHLEELTRGQPKSTFWFCFRSGRITASWFHQVVHTNLHKLALSLIYQIQNLLYYSQKQHSLVVIMKTELLTLINPRW